ncbi:MAG: mechanosensitive ion channel [Candidatus Latescibacteria bacterium]|nr:mechanosensitive ion channel [Candidatus Latescibacterota bacterium]
MENWLIKLQDLFTVFGLRIIAALAIFIIGRWIAKLLKKVIHKIMVKRNIEPTIMTFLENLIYVLIMTFVILAALARLGIQTASFVAVIGAAGLAVGFALQGSLANFAAGFLMIIFKPIKVGDYIEGAGTAGVVESIGIFTTVLATPDNKTIIIPNSKLTGDNITNYSTKEIRRVDFKFGVAYNADIQKVKRIIEEVLKNDTRILDSPAPTIGLLELASSSLNFAVRPWVKTPDYWDVYFNITENMKKQFDNEGIRIPFPQTDVHLYQK